MRKVAYGTVCAASVALFVALSAVAYAQRGYFAVGGEAFALLIPLLTWCGEGIARCEAEDRGKM